MRLSLTTTIEAGFGSRLMTGGFLLNNELTDFSLRAAGERAPGRQPGPAGQAAAQLDGADDGVRRTSGDPMLLLGSPGGSRIIGYVAARWSASWTGDDAAGGDRHGPCANRNGPTELEPGTAAAGLEAALRARGHEVRLAEQSSGLHAIQIEAGRLVSGVDPRREGAARGRS